MEKSMFHHRIAALILGTALTASLLAGCGSSSTVSADSSAASVSAEATALENTTASETDTSGTTSDNSAFSDVEPESAVSAADSTAAVLPLCDETETISYWFEMSPMVAGYLNTMNDNITYQYLEELTNVHVDFRAVSDETAQNFNLMVASGDWADIMVWGSNYYSGGAVKAVEDGVFMELTDVINEYMPNYSSLIQDKDIYPQVIMNDGKIGEIFPIDWGTSKPGTGPIVRKDWLDDLGIDPASIETYDDYHTMLTRFKNEKGASQALYLGPYGVPYGNYLAAGYGIAAYCDPSSDTGSFYQEDGKVIYGATQDGTRKFLSWLHTLYDQGLINFENMQNRDVNPFGDLNAGEASRGETGYIFSNQPFGGNYSTMAADNGDPNCNWWPVQDVAEVSGQTIPFYEETSMVDTAGAAKISISTQCENVETALQFLDYGYSYEGGLLYNYGFEKGSGHDVETWYYDDNGDPMFDGDALLSVADATNLASGVVSTKDLAGVIYDTRLSFEFGERELSCFDAWSTNKNSSNNLGSDVVLTSEESTEASAIYSDIITHVATSALQFINGAQDVDDDAVWNAYVKGIEDMNIDGLTQIIQGAYDRVN